MLNGLQPTCTFIFCRLHCTVSYDVFVFFLSLFLSVCSVNTGVVLDRIFILVVDYMEGTLSVAT